MIGLIILGLAFVFFLVVAYFCAQTWHVGHIVSMVFLFLFTLLTLFLTATVLRTNKEYHPKYLSAAADLERETAKTDTLMFGSPSDPDGKDSVVGERTMAQAETMARGRVWRNVFRVPGPQPNGIALTMRAWTNDGCQRVGQEDEEEFADEDIEPEPDAGADDAAADAAEVDAARASSHGIVAGQYVYGFKEVAIARMSPAQKDYYFSVLGGEGEESFANQDTKGRCRVPVGYVGKFYVVEANDNAIIVQLQGRPDPGQIAQLENKAPWALYERLPTDVAELFGEEMDKAKIAQVLPVEWFAMGGLQMSPAAYNQMIDEYARDGKTGGRTNDPMRSRVEVNFLKEHTQEVDLQVADGNLPPADTPFNVQGLAQVKNMLQGEPTKFEKDQRAFFDAATAQRLQREGVVEIVGEPLYQRQLRSFEFGLDDYQKKFGVLSEDIQSVKSRLADLTQSLNNLQSQIDKHREELEQLQEDKQNFDSERDALRQYRDMLKQRFESLQNEVNSLTLARG